MKGNNYKAGLFVLAAMALLIIMILKVSQGGFLFSGTYPIYLEVDSAVGLAENTPVQIAGVDIGVVDKIHLTDQNKAKLKLAIKNGIKISKNARAMIKTTGILGDAFIEIYEPGPMVEQMEKNSVIKNVRSYGDFSSITNQISAISDDVKAITAQLRKVIAGDDSTFNKTMKDIEKIAAALSRMTTANEGNINTIIANVKALSENLNYIVARNAGNIDHTIHNIEDITNTIASGEGTIGKLINDDETVNKLNDTLDGINEFIGGTNRLKVDLGMHTEYLGGTNDFKSYVSLKLKPRPDKFFLFEAVNDPDPSFNTVIEETTVTSGGTTSSFTTKKLSKRLDDFKFSAQFGKKFHDFTIRGGLIESTGGVGLDYDNGPFGASFSAFDFRSADDQRPHLKAYGTARVTRSFYLMGGLDDIINKNQDLAWFLGAGISFTDDDVKSLLGLIAAGAR